MIKAILFDLDETLIVDHEVTLHALKACVLKAGQYHSLNQELLADSAKKFAVSLWEQNPVFAFTQRIGHSASEALWAKYDSHVSPEIALLEQWAPAFRSNVWRLSLGEQGIENQDLTAELSEIFFNTRRIYPRFPEIDSLLLKLKESYKLGIVTNGVDDLQREKLHGCGLLGYFDASVISGTINIGKPEKGIFERITNELNVDPSECVMVGDNPERDIAGANNSGMASVFVERGVKPYDLRHPASFQCNNLSAMLEWLNNI